MKGHDDEHFTSLHFTSLYDDDDEKTTMATRRLLRPLMDRVLVEKITPPTKSVGGVLLPETMTGKQVRWMDDDGREGGFFSPLWFVERLVATTVEERKDERKVTDEDNECGGASTPLSVFFQRRRTRRW